MATRNIRKISGTVLAAAQDPRTTGLEHLPLRLLAAVPLSCPAPARYGTIHMTMQTREKKKKEA